MQRETESQLHRKARTSVSTKYTKHDSNYELSNTTNGGAFQEQYMLFTGLSTQSNEDIQRKNKFSLPDTDE